MILKRRKWQNLLLGRLHSRIIHIGPSRECLIYYFIKIEDITLCNNRLYSTTETRAIIIQRGRVTLQRNRTLALSWKTMCSPLFDGSAAVTGCSVHWWGNVLNNRSNWPCHTTSMLPHNQQYSAIAMDWKNIKYQRSKVVITTDEIHYIVMLIAREIKATTNNR